jgi:hypothetical protein
VSKKKPAGKKQSSSIQQKNARKFYVFTALTGALTMTGALLLAISPQPLRPDASLSAVEGPDAFASIYSTPSPVTAGRWKYVYVHHSRSLTPPAVTTDHFILTDEGLQPTSLWLNQSPATPPTGNGSIDPTCISICVVGDFDRSLPTPTQQHRLSRLIDSLQSKLRLPTRSVIMLDQPNTPASVGKHFPAADFRSQLLQ